MHTRDISYLADCASFAIANNARAVLRLLWRHACLVQVPGKGLKCQSVEWGFVMARISVPGFSWLGLRRIWLWLGLRRTHNGARYRIEATGTESSILDMPPKFNCRNFNHQFISG
jgi:hypothetical protein